VEDFEGSEEKRKKVLRPRPGHADLAGMIKYNYHDARYILERASARETTARVAVGAMAKELLREFGRLNDADVRGHLFGGAGGDALAGRN